MNNATIVNSKTLKNASYSELRSILRNSTYSEFCAVKLNAKKEILIKEIKRVNRVLSTQPKPTASAKAATSKQPKPTASAKAATSKQPKPTTSAKAATSKQPKPTASAKAATSKQPKPTTSAKAATSKQPKPTARTNRSKLHAWLEVSKKEFIKPIKNDTNNSKVILFMFQNNGIKRSDYEKLNLPSPRQISQSIAVISEKGYGVTCEDNIYRLLLPEGMTQPLIN